MKLTIGLIQEARTADVAHNRDQTAHKVRSLARQGAQLICLQELYSSLYFCQTQDYQAFSLAEPLQGPSYQSLAPIAQEFGVSIVVPIFEERAPGLYHNSAYVIGPNGAATRPYRKQHIPHDPGFEEKFYFAPGDGGYQVQEAAGARIGTLICWDQWYPEAARLTSLMGAQILIYPTAIGYSAGESAAEGAAQLAAWQAIQRSHAIANGVFVVSVNRVGSEGGIRFWGHSFVCNPLGEVLAQTGEDPAELLLEIDLAQIAWFRQRWPFLRDRRTDTYGPLIQRFLD